MPVPGRGLEAEMLLRRHLAGQQTQQADNQEDRPDQHVEAVEAGGHEEDRTVQARVQRRFVEEQVLMENVLVLIDLHRGEQHAEGDGDGEADLGGLAIADLQGVVGPGHRRARQQQDDGVQQRQLPGIEQLDALRRPGRPGSGGIGPAGDFGDMGARARTLR
eukprot:TRINITY_DN14952_c0_g1_i1.p2 TRINITY_DN14952_c0_g1~~TRINITY_DN14952_c0_g1_i1.p2  ORF type:complete len:162 (-),score=19.77 TRINITY_DN14952_c0_g1_i1:20-505(-)